MTAVLVTGGAGYVGSHSCKALAGAGFVPVTYDNLSRGHRYAVKWGPLEVGDIRDRDAPRYRVAHASSGRDPALRRLRLCRRVRRQSGAVLRQQCHRLARPAGSRARGRNRLRRVFEQLHGVRPAAFDAGHRGHAVRADQPLWPHQGDRRGHAWRLSNRLWHALDRAALFQRVRGRPRSARPAKTTIPSRISFRGR